MRDLAPTAHPPLTAYQARQVEGPTCVVSDESCDACGFAGDVDLAIWSITRFVDYTEFTCPGCGLIHDGDRDLADDVGEYYADMARDDR